MEKVNKKVFEVEVDGKATRYEVRRPDQRARQRANLAYARTFRQLVKPDDGQPGAIVRAALENVMREQKLWDDAKQAELAELNGKILDGEKRLLGGGFKLKEARALALDLRRWRSQRNALLSSRNELDLNTAEAQAEQARFNHLVANCTYRDGEPAFKSEEDYVGRPDDDPVASKAAAAFGQLYYGLDDDYLKKLPENAFLLKWKFCREKDLHLIDERGELVNADGRRVDEDGNLLDDQGNIVDDRGNRRDKDGKLVVEHRPFLDDDGVAIEERAEALLG